MTVEITSPSLRTALTLSAADRRWIDFISQSVQETWDADNPDRPKDLGYMASEDFIRLQFEEYLLALLAAVKYHLYLQTPNPHLMSSIEGDPIADFSQEWFEHWQRTPAYTLFIDKTDSHLFDIVEPKHPTAGNLTFDDIQRRVAMQVQTLHLDERFATSKETLGKHLATGQKKVTTAFNNFWSDLETMRENQRKRNEMASHGLTEDSHFKRSASPAPSTSSGSGAQASLQAAGAKAGAYVSSWGSWAAERRKDWVKPAPSTGAADDSTSTPAIVITEKDQRTEYGKENGNGSHAESKAAPATTGKWARWASAASGQLRGSGGLKEEKGGDGIGRLEA